MAYSNPITLTSKLSQFLAFIDQFDLSIALLFSAIIFLGISQVLDKREKEDNSASFLWKILSYVSVIGAILSAIFVVVKMVLF